MTTSKQGFTKGPYEFAECGRTSYGASENVHHEIRPEGTDGWLDKEYLRVSGICTLDTARLLASAPELYEALAEAIDWMETVSNNGYLDSSFDDPPLPEARAALARAAGESE